MHTHFEKVALPAEGALVIRVYEDMKLGIKAEELDKKTGGAIARALKNASHFKGKKSETLSILAPAGVKNPLILLVGLGKTKDITTRIFEEVAGKLYSALLPSKVREACVLFENNTDVKISLSDQAAHMAYGMKLKSYRFDKYRTKEKQENRPQLQDVTFQLDKPDAAQDFYENYLKKIANGVFFARDLITEPPNVLHPESYAERCEQLEDMNIEVKILGEKEMQLLGMGALLGVGQGSIRESKMVIMRWFGDPKGRDAQPLAFVGKGVTFDTGGISIKPATGMEDMKYDMGGSAAVVGLMKALAGRKAKVNAVGVIGLVENMPGHNAQRPSDVVSTMSGQTVEVLNTDAEGRLVLADALWYTQDNFSPKFMVNLATLTGAITVALGSEYAGLFSNNDKLSANLVKAGQAVNERLWRFPMGEEYDKYLESKIADMQNISNGKGAGSITAAQFLERFVNKTPWAHLDIAGVAWARKDVDICPEGAVGFGVRLLDRLVADNYES
ncbi:MAG: Leucyl aminopeptidase [Rickettsiales bacterium]|jgi:leucyl aminopeptidase|nr:Leucyl aminopeptidase [Rickettsiales bacterium]